jgi:hypothetical protein
VGVDLGQVDPALGAVVVEEAQLDPGGHLREDPEVGAGSVERRAQRVRGAGPDLHGHILSGPRSRARTASSARRLRRVLSHLILLGVPPFRTPPPDYTPVIPVTRVTSAPSARCGSTGRCHPHAAGTPAQRAPSSQRILRAAAPATPRSGTVNDLEALQSWTPSFGIKIRPGDGGTRTEQTDLEALRS